MLRMVCNVEGARVLFGSRRNDEGDMIEENVQNFNSYVVPCGVSLLTFPMGMDHKHG